MHDTMAQNNKEEYLRLQLASLALQLFMSPHNFLRFGQQIHCVIGVYAQLTHARL